MPGKYLLKCFQMALTKSRDKKQVLDPEVDDELDIEKAKS